MRFIRSLLVLLSALVSCIQAKAQFEPSGEHLFGLVSKEDLAMTEYKEDSFATAVVLLDYGFVGYDLLEKKYYLQYHTRIKILKNEAFDLANVSIPFAGRSGLKRLEAATHNLVDGEKETVLLTKENMVDEKVKERVRMKTLSFPGVVEGTVIEYKYRQFATSPFVFLPWYFQSEYPVRNSEFWMYVPGGEQLLPRLFGHESL